MPVRRFFFRAFLLGLPAASPACTGDDVTGPPGVAVEITVTTTGIELDADGYTVQVDAKSARPVKSIESIQTRDIQPGDHTIYLGGVADNCTVRGANPRTVTVPAEGVRITIEVVCAGRTGQVLVSTRTRGPSSDPRSHVIAIDDSVRAAIDTGIVLLQGLAPGTHVIELQGVPPHCTADGNPRGVTVRPGQTTTLEFPIVCIGLHGTLEIRTQSFGQWNPTGYSALVDEGSTYRIGPSDLVIIPGMEAGPHQVRLQQVPPNCTLLGENPTTVVVRAGRPQAVMFKVYCDLFPSGSLHVTVTTRGTPQEDAYSLVLNGSLAFGVAAIGSVIISGLQPDTYIVELVGYSNQCTVAGKNPQDVTVRSQLATELIYVVTCPATE
jgi:hypothetical protein